MGQIKNIKLHIVTDIKLLRIYLATGKGRYQDDIMSGAGARYALRLTRIARMVQPRIAQNLSLARSELTPPSYQGLKADLNTLRMPVRADITGATMNELAGKALVVAEVYLWFNLGVVLGKGRVIGFGFTDEELAE